ncbi:hypothetical protein P0Y43_20505 [Pseudomonas entomophila]|uniref:hypothetical protein n=1 Tax=Pseudomonas entomophila TaxID=312306 RepID=UPI0023D7C023|nr:hypothetical protein [Pseudomonas entomophila]MDF0733078.1 hypothetical protein [Pseudomonas entomophila]
MTYFLFLLGVTTSVSLAYFLRTKLSGERFSFLGFSGALAYNVFFLTYYLRYAETEHLLFFGHYPSLLYDHTSVIWICIAAMLLHCYAMPVQWRPRKWFNGKK